LLVVLLLLLLVVVVAAEAVVVVVVVAAAGKFLKTISRTYPESKQRLNFLLTLSHALCTALCAGLNFKEYRKRGSMFGIHFPFRYSYVL
jgi:hypothetical protein